MSPPRIFFLQQKATTLALYHGPDCWSPCDLTASHATEDKRGKGIDEETEERGQKRQEKKEEGRKER